MVTEAGKIVSLIAAETFMMSSGHTTDGLAMASCRGD
jgi:hypothetical protein